MEGLSSKYAFLYRSNTEVCRAAFAPMLRSLTAPYPPLPGRVCPAHGGTGHGAVSFELGSSVVELPTKGLVSFLPPPVPFLK